MLNDGLCLIIIMDSYSFERATHLIAEGDLDVSLTDLNHAKELFMHAGVVVFDASLDVDFLEQCRGEFVNYFAHVEQQLQNRKVDMDRPFNFNEICRRQHGRYDMRGLPSNSFRSEVWALNNAPWRDFIDLVLGHDAVELWRGVVLNQYGSEPQHWHRDGPHLFETEGHLAPHCVTIFVPLVPTTVSMGFTSFYPGSHAAHRSHLYGLDYNPNHSYDGGPCSYLQTATPEIDFGGWLAFDYRVVHRGDANVDHELKRDRPMLYFVYAKPWFKDSNNFPEDASLFSSTNVDGDTSSRPPGLADSIRSFYYFVSSVCDGCGAGIFKPGADSLFSFLKRRSYMA